MRIVNQPTPTTQPRTVTIISDGALFRWQLEWSPVKRTVSTTAFTTIAAVIEAAEVIAASYQAVRQ